VPTTTYYGEPMLIEVRYWDVDNDQPVTGADVKVNFGGQLLANLSYAGNGIYRYSTDEFSLVPDSYLIQISASKDNYASKIASRVLAVQRRATELKIYYKDSEVSAISDYWEDEYIIELEYNDITTGISTPITDPSPKVISVMRYVGGQEFEEIYTTEAYWNASIGKFQAKINMTEVGVGTFVVRITMSKTYYESQVLEITLTVTNRRTSVNVVPNVVEVLWNDSVRIVVNYTDDLLNEPIDADNATYAIYLVGSSTPTAEGDLTRISEGSYELVIPRDVSYTLIDEGAYYIVFRFEKQFYETKEIRVDYTVNIRPTSYQVNNENFNVYIDEGTDIVVVYIDDATHSGIATATFSYTIEVFGGETITPTPGQLITYPNGTYVISLDPYELSTGKYLVHITIAFEHYQTQNIDITINVELVPTTTIYQGSYNITWGDIQKIDINVLSQRPSEGALSGLQASAKIIDESTGAETSIDILDSGNGKYTVSMDSTEFDPGLYQLQITFSSNTYNISSVTIRITINKIVISTTYDAEISALKNPITGSTVTEIRISLYDESREGTPIRDATVKYYIYSGETLLKGGTLTEVEGLPGVYAAKIDWTPFEPNVYTIKVIVEEVQIRGNKYDASAVTQLTTGESPQLIITASIDYLGGTITFAGMKLPTVVFVPSISALLILGSILAYKFYQYRKLPPEVREIDQIIKLLKKGILEYTAPEREEVFKEIFLEALS